MVKIKRILYKGKAKRKFQAGGAVTFFADPGFYNPEEDFYAKNAYSRYNAAQSGTGKNKNSETLKKGDFVKPNYVTTGTSGVNNMYNSLIDKKAKEVNDIIHEYGPTDPRALSAAAELDRLHSEAATKAQTITDAKNTVIKDFTDKQLDSQAFINGGYIVRDNKTGDIKNMDPFEFWNQKNKRKFSIMRVRDVLREYENQPFADSFEYDKLAQIKSGSEYLKENVDPWVTRVKSKMSMEGLLTDGGVIPLDEIIEQGNNVKLYGNVYTTDNTLGLAKVYRDIVEETTSNAAAYNSLRREVWANPDNKNILLEIKDQDKRDIEERKMINYAIYDKVMLSAVNNVKATFKKEKDKNKAEDSGAEKKVKAATIDEIYGSGKDPDETVNIVGISSHADDDGTEYMHIYRGTKPSELAENINKANAEASSSGSKKSNSLLDINLPEIKLNEMYSASGANMSKLTGLTPSELRRNSIIKEPSSLVAINYLTDVDGKPMIGYSKFMEEYVKRFKYIYEEPNSEFSALSDKDIEKRKIAARKLVIENMAQQFSNDPEIMQVLNTVYRTNNNGELVTVTVPTKRYIKADIQISLPSGVDKIAADYDKYGVKHIEKSGKKVENTDDFYNINKRVDKPFFESNPYANSVYQTTVLFPALNYSAGLTKDGDSFYGSMHNKRVSQVNSANELSINNFFKSLEN